MFKCLFSYYLTLGLEQEDMAYNFSGYTKKPNIVYRLYKRFNRQFGDECANYLNRHKGKSVKYSKRIHEEILRELEVS